MERKPGSPDYINRTARDRAWSRLLHDTSAYLSNVLQGTRNILRYVDNERGYGPSTVADKIKRSVSSIDATRKYIEGRIAPFKTMLIEDRYPRFGVKLESFRGLGVGAVHWNARGWYLFPGGEYQEFAVGYIMNDKQAALLSEPDYTYHRGDYCERFFSEDEAVNAGVRELVKRFGYEIVVERGAIHYDDNAIAHDGMEKAAKRLQERLNNWRTGQ